MQLSKLMLAAGLTLITGRSIAQLGPTTPVPISMLQLLSNPEQFDGKQIGVVGFAEFDGRATLYLHREDEEHDLTVNSINVDCSELSDADRAFFNLKYVYLAGTFNSKNRGRFGAQGGSFVHCGAGLIWPKRPTETKSAPGGH